jgi:redox-sensitive bicupin YhaK (pirin superfamily)
MTALELIAPCTHDLGGGFLVKRVLPAAHRQAVGPFLFFDHFGPVTALPADNHDVRPHPHIGLATLTWLFEGAMMHRDSTGVVQRIEPGAINWMTAGRGIVHSERTPDDLRGATRRSHGLQLWVALPEAHEEVEPQFQHVPAHQVPGLHFERAELRVLVGEAWGLKSPVRTLSPTLYLDIRLESGATLVLPDLATERAVYGVNASFIVDGQAVPAHQLAVLPSGQAVTLSSTSAAHLVLVGGEPLGHRFIAWNFVSSRKDRIATAKDDWQTQRFAAVPGETEFIPLPAG